MNVATAILEQRNQSIRERSNLMDRGIEETSGAIIVRNMRDVPTADVANPCCRREKWLAIGAHYHIY